MEGTNNLDDNIDIGDNVDDNSDVEEDDSDTRDYRYDLDKDIFEELRKNNPAITHLGILLSCNDDGVCFFNAINWKKEDGDCIANNTNLKKLLIFHVRHNNEEDYILGEEEGNEKPTKQNLQDFFSCIHRNRTINEISFSSIQIVDEFGGDLIEGLQGHPSITKFDFKGGGLGSIGCTALEKVLKHPKSRLKSLHLRRCQLDDEEIGIVCGALLGNSRMKRLSFNINQDITPDGWRALSPVIRHPNCNLIELELYHTRINDERANILGGILRGSSIKALHLNYNRSISGEGWHTLLNHLSQTSIKSLNISQNKIDDDGIALVANIETVESLNMGSNYKCTPSGWRSFFNTLQTRGTRLKKLDISWNNIGNEGAAVLGSLLSNMNSLKTLEMGSMSYSSSPGVSNTITTRGWQTLFTTLRGSNLDLAKLILCSNSIDDEGIQHLVHLVSNMSSLKELRLDNNYSVTTIGWQALTSYFRSPHFALEDLDLDENNINDDTLIAFTSALAQNKTLKSLYLYHSGHEDSEDNDLITERGWEAVSNLLCNKTSILETYNSNHTLQDLGYRHDEMNLPSDLSLHLDLNRNEDKVEVARQKILQTHFSTNEDDDSSNMQELLGMELEMMPAAISWIGRPLPTIGWIRKKVSGLSLLYNLMRRMPDLFDSSAQAKPSAVKRKRDNSPDI